MKLVLDTNIFISAFYSWRGFNTPPLWGGHKGLNPRPIPFKNNIPRCSAAGYVDWDGNSQQIINRVIEGQDELYITNEIINEIEDVMGRPKFKTKPEIIERYVRTIEKIGKKVFITGKVKGICRDKDDDDKLECGLLSGADYLITGDSDLLVLREYQQMRIKAVKSFFEIISGQKVKGVEFGSP